MVPQNILEQRWQTLKKMDQTRLNVRGKTFAKNNTE